MKEIDEYLAYAQANPGHFARSTKKCLARVEKLCNIARQENGNIIYNERAVYKVLKVLSLIKHDGEEYLQLLPWQKFLIASIYGFRWRDTGRIVFNDVFLYIAKKNGKTALASGLALYYLLTMRSAQIILTATDYNQAKIAYDDIVRYIKGTPDLANNLANGKLFIRELPTPKVANKTKLSAIEILPETREDAAQGRKPSFALFDEIASYRTSSIIQKVSTGIIDPNAIRISLTTAETNLNNPGYWEYQRAQNVIAGKQEAVNYLPLIYELDPEDRRDDEKTYIKANPSLDVIKPLWRLVEDRDRAKQNPIEEAGFYAYHLNIWSNAPTADISVEQWEPAITQYEKYKQYLTEEKLKTYTAFGAIDLSKVDDYSAYTIYFWVEPIKRFYARHRFYIPEGQLEKRFQRESEMLRLWIRDGYVTPTIDGGQNLTINYDVILADLLQDWETFQRLQGYAYDATYASNFLRQVAQAKTYRPVVMVPFSQTWSKIAPANKDWLDLVYKGHIIDPNPVMRWMVGNVKRKEDRNGNISFVKADYAQSNLRIDGVDTSVMALAMLLGRIGKQDKAPEEQIRTIETIDY